MSYVKITSFLALMGTAAAVPHYSHGKFHSKGSDKPYPSGGWAGQYNSTVVPVAATGTGVYGEQTTTLGLTSTSTQTLVSTIYGTMPSGVPGADVPAEAAEAGESHCGGTVTVTASEKVTVTITPGADVPKSSAPAAEYPAETPEEKTTPAAEYPASTPEAATSSAAGYETPDLAKKPVESAPTASSASASAAPSPSAGATYSGGKRGLAYNDAKLCKSFGSNFGFGYNWGDVENNDIGTMFIPMMHTPAKSTPEKWLGNVKTAVGKGSTAVMGFNECDHTDQCNMEPEAACAAWKQYMNPVKEAHPSVTIIGPSVTNGQAPMGLDWLTRFHDCCPDATIDATNIHFYDIYNEGTIQRFKEQVETASKIYGKPVWITEFGLNPGSATETEAASFLKEAMEYCDGSDKVQGYSWFMVGDGENQLNAGEGLSAVGKVYAGSA